MKNITGIMLALLISMTSCGKNDNKTAVPVTPSNLVVTANVSIDGSGVVAFSATADNAVTYDYDFGNGNYMTAPTGKINYTYSTPGNNTYTVTVTAKSKDALVITKSVQVVISVANNPVWADEFNTNGAPDQAKWGYDLGTGDNGWGNQEKQYYTNRTQNVEVSNGTLKITAMKEAHQGSAYTSTRMLTKGKFSFKYGRVEARAKLPIGGGTWPAIWMLGDNVSTIGWPACGEIDIMEHNGNNLNKIYGTMHYPGRSGGNADGGTTMITNAATEFHKYAVDWTPAFIKVYVDDQLFFTYVNTAASPFNNNFFVILNFAMGGAFGGAIDPAYTSSTFEVDYVRVYKN
ncbi:family 16 glycosylhydrolase [Chitinophaga sp. SYP-B3965]|uniref:family 16 glycosylhydrolase n=1 Tax=Chitinophaga sp. SYP-B3965 TaxID=2663120 RepID=UPI00129952D3|nr:family 16 glycosylhydrolase [Chitinophaga sp. SYP-B3965]MRG44975.1 family 16 glycosylhydrolase [Chitinophaga sp. SYP-B3965]